MTWKAKVVLFHDPSQVEFQPGDVVPDAIVAEEQWLVERGLVIDSKGKQQPQDTPAAPATAEVNPDDIEAAQADEEG